jgi:hypothetical protein
VHFQFLFMDLLIKLRRIQGVKDPRIQVKSWSQKP